jgi:hypothetical protein
MRKSTRHELNKLREMFWYLIRGKRCAACHELFVEDDAWIVMPHGTGHGQPMGKLQITIDHRVTLGGNAPRNMRLMHKSCHGRHHMKDRYAALRKQAVEARRRGESK